jgi:hypothetical protein
MKFVNFITFTLVFSKNYLLTPHKHHIHSFNYQSFAEEHNLNVLISMDDLTIYSTSEENYKLFMASLSELFDVEEDKTIALPLPIVHDINQPSLADKLNFVPWHLDRIGKRDLPLDHTFDYNSKGSCHQNKNITINTYIVDTGIDIRHSEFEGRAKWLANFAEDNIDTDCNSHGTHCAGLVGSKTYGVCKDANLFAIKVLDCQGSGTFSGILNGLEFIHKRHSDEFKHNNQVKSIISMSLGGGFSSTINRAVEVLAKTKSMYVVVAAGNENNDACNTSPASANGILTIMASDKYDNRAYFSNYGTCADLYAPGVDILSTIPNDQTAVYSGTSMATPNLVGVLNHYLDVNPSLNMQQVKEKMIKDASKNKLSNNPRKTNNLLVYLHREIK